MRCFRIADRYTILRNGRRRGRRATSRDTTVEAVITAMAGRPIDAVFPSLDSPSPGPVVLDVPRAERPARPRRVVRACAPARSWASPAWPAPGAASCCASSAARRVAARAGLRARRSAVRAAQSRRRPTARASCWCPRSDGPRRSRPTPWSATSTRPPSTAQALGSVVVSRARERAHAQGLWEAFDVRGRGTRPGGADALGRQPAEGRAGQVPGPRAAGAAAGRADARRGRVHEEPDLPASSATRLRPAARCSWSAPSCPRSSACATGSWCSTRGACPARFDRGGATEEQLLHVCYGRAA